MHPLIPWFEPLRFDIPIDSPGSDGPLALHGFGALVLAGFIAGSFGAAMRAERVGLDPDPILRLVGWLALGTFLGGHIGYELMYEPEVLLTDPLKLLRLWDGLSSFGGFIVCIPLTFYFFRRLALPMWKYVDVLSYGLTLGFFFGRMGCFSAHDHPGLETNFWLGVYGICPGQGKDVACHDMGLYEALWSLSMFFLFTLLQRRARIPGFYPLLLGTVYAPVRFGMDFLRPLDTRYLGLTPAQILCVGVLGLCAYGWTRRIASGDAPWPQPGTLRDDED